MADHADRKIVLVTRRTQLEELLAEFNTLGQARFAITRARGSLAAARGRADQAAEQIALAEHEFDAIEQAHTIYRAAVERLRSELRLGVPVQTLDRALVPTFLFGPGDVVVTVGPDGLVANTAKYAGGCPVVGVNPDPARIDGVLLPFGVERARAAAAAALSGKAKLRPVTLAEVVLSDGQRLLAFNDLYLGRRTHISARYRLRVRERAEDQSSSGLLVSTGAGSTGWLSSVVTMACGVAAFARADGGGAGVSPVRLAWEDRRLVYVVREPFVSKASSATIIAGVLEDREELFVESQMPADGVIFSDGIEEDYLRFGAGVVAQVRAADTQAQLVVP